MICHGIKSKAYLEWWRLLKYTFGDVKNVEFFFIFQIFSRALKDFIKSSNLGATQPKSIIQGRKRLDTTYLQIVDNSSKNKNIITSMNTFAHCMINLYY